DRSTIRISASSTIFLRFKNETPRWWDFLAARHSIFCTTEQQLAKSLSVLCFLHKHFNGTLIRTALDHVTNATIDGNVLSVNGGGVGIGSCTATVSWGTAFSDNAYTAACSINGSNLFVQSIGNQLSGSLNVTIQNAAGTSSCQFRDNRVHCNPRLVRDLLI